jgi:hypothetical protein
MSLHGALDTSVAVLYRSGLGDLSPHTFANMHGDVVSILMVNGSRPVEPLRMVG